jgi:hypothetical protein
MSGSIYAIVITPIVVAFLIAAWIAAVFYANAHPGWKHQAPPPKYEVTGGSFQAIDGGRQLMPHYLEVAEPGQPGAVRPATVPAQRSASGAPQHEPSGREATVPAQGQPEESRPTAGNRLR